MAALGSPTRASAGRRRPRRGSGAGLLKARVEASEKCPRWGCCELVSTKGAKLSGGGGDGGHEDVARHVAPRAIALLVPAQSRAAPEREQGMGGRLPRRPCRGSDARFRRPCADAQRAARAPPSTESAASSKRDDRGLRPLTAQAVRSRLARCALALASPVRVAAFPRATSRAQGGKGRPTRVVKPNGAQAAQRPRPDEAHCSPGRAGTGCLYATWVRESTRAASSARAARSTQVPANSPEIRPAAPMARGCLLYTSPSPRD